MHTGVRVPCSNWALDEGEDETADNLSLSIQYALPEEFANHSGVAQLIMIHNRREMQGFQHVKRDLKLKEGDVIYVGLRSVFEVRQDSDVTACDGCKKRITGKHFVLDVAGSRPGHLCGSCHERQPRPGWTLLHDHANVDDRPWHVKPRVIHQSALLGTIDSELFVDLNVDAKTPARRDGDAKFTAFVAPAGIAVR